MSSLASMSIAELHDLYKTASPHIRQLILALFYSMGIPF